MRVACFKHHVAAITIMREPDTSFDALDQASLEALNGMNSAVLQRDARCCKVLRRVSARLVALTRAPDDAREWVAEVAGREWKGCHV
jgi:hypothetical protein